MPKGAVCVFSAHGVAPSVREGAIARQLRTIDATCPLVTKVHREAVRFAQDGYTIVLVGHDGHEEVEGTMGEAPDRIVLVQNEADVDELQVADPERVAYITQTTLAVDETTAILDEAARRFPKITGPRTDDICYATTNRQAAVKQMADSCDLLLVIGSRNSSNSVRLVEVARDCGTESHLIDTAAESSEEWLDGARVVGISSGASAPENLVQELVQLFRDRGVSDISEFHVIREDVRFMLPKTIREAAAVGEATERSAAPVWRRSDGPPDASRSACGDAHADPLRPASRRRVRRSTCCAARSCARRCSSALETSIGWSCSATCSSCVTVRRARRSRRRGRSSRTLGGALGGRELVLVAGNHDHALIEPWLARRAEQAEPPPLGSSS